MENFAHLVEIDEEKKSVTIFRIDSETGRRILYTSLEILSEDAEIGQTLFQDLARQLGENLLLDSPAARRLLGI